MAPSRVVRPLAAVPRTICAVAIALGVLPSSHGARYDPKGPLYGLFDLVLSAAGLAPRPSDGPGTRAVLAEVWHPPAPGVGAWKVLWEGSLKYMHSGEGAHRLYDLAADPNERVNRIADRPDDARRMELDLDEVLASLPPPPPAGERSRKGGLQAGSGSGVRVRVLGRLPGQSRPEARETTSMASPTRTRPGSTTHR